MYEIYADNKYISKEKDIKTCLLVVEYLYKNFDYKRVRIERTEDE